MAKRSSRESMVIHDWTTMRVWGTHGETCHQHKNKRFTNDLVDFIGPTSPFIHALTRSCTAEASVRTVYPANPSLHALWGFAQGLNWGVKAGCDEVVEVAEAHSACSETVCLHAPPKIRCSGMFLSTVLPTNQCPCRKN